MRELQLWDADAGVGDAFADVEQFAAACRFRDCSHGEEPGCAVRAALATGELPPERYASFTKLRGELQRRDGRGRRSPSRRRG
jgi:ribosome biogenesis GTPase